MTCSHIVAFAAFATAASAIHLCVSAIVSVWFPHPFIDKRPIFAMLGRGAVKFVLLPVVGLSFLSSSLSDVYVSVFKVAAAPFAILYAFGSMTHFYWAVIDFQRFFSLNHSEPLQVVPPQHQSGRQHRNGRHNLPEAQHPANDMQRIESVEQRARRLLNSMASPKKRFMDQDCPICFDAMHQEEEANKDISPASSCRGASGSRASHSFLKTIYLPCGHGMHQACCVEVVKLGLIGAKCPMCRSPLFSRPVGRQLFL